MTEIPPALQGLGFLVGRFRGAGSFVGNSVTFEKESLGGWEVGARFLTLRMIATYRFGEEVADVHEAMVVVGVDPKTGLPEARAFTDSGAILHYEIRLDDGRVGFADRVPHEIRAARARKWLAPRAGGYEEVLEVDRGEGRFEPYSRVDMWASK